MKRCAIITYRHGIYELPDLHAKMGILLIMTKKSRKIAIKPSRSALFRMKTRVSPKYFVTAGNPFLILTRYKPPQT